MPKRYDVFLSHNSTDKPAVEYLAQKLRKAGLEPFLDTWHLVPGEPWQDALEDALDQSRTCAVFLGPRGLGPWENEEMRVALDERVRNPDFRVIPVLLPDTEMPERGRLPRFLRRLRWVDFRKGLGDAYAFYLLTCGIKGVQPVPPPDITEEVCPYRGLQSFHEEHAEFFFGREALTQWLVERLRLSTGSSQTSRFLAVIGPSGSGKSSVVRAGLIPALRQGALPGSETWTILVMRPDAHPLEELAAHLAPLLAGEGDRVAKKMLQLQDELQSDRRTLHAEVRLGLGEKDPNVSILIVVDQFEELFTLCRDEKERQSFLNNLLYASGIVQGRTAVVIAMRADFYAQAAAYPELADRMADHQVLVTPMEETELRQAIETPAQQVGLTFDPGLVDTILDDVLGEPGALPLLEHALLQLWERRRGRQLTFEAYQKIGRVDGAVARRAEAEYGELTAEQKKVARRTLLRLVQPGEGTEDTRRRARLSELVPGPEQAPVVEAVVQKLANARLLTTARDTATGEELVEVAHEALIRGWHKLRDWLDEDRDALRIQRRLTERAHDWESVGRDPGALYRGVHLAQAIGWAENHADELSPLEREFLAASIALLAEADWAKGNSKRARDYFKDAIAQAPNFADAYLSLHHLLVEMGELGEAAEVYREILVRAPERALLPSRYEIKAVLGQTELGVTYQVWDQDQAQLEAVTLLRRALAPPPEVLEHFKEEIGQLQSERISRFLGLDLYRDRYFIVTEYVEGPTLRSRLDADNVMALTQVYEIFDQVAEALEDAHRQGVPHLNLQASNIVLTAEGAKLVNFGFSRLAKPFHPSAPIVGVGTEYQSPEQRAGRVGDERSDVYALGTILYEMLAAFRQAGEIHPQVDEAIDILIATARAADPAERLLSIDQMRREMKRIFPALLSRRGLLLVLSWISRLYSRPFTVERELLILAIIVAFAVGEIWETLADLRGISRFGLLLLINGLIPGTISDYIVRRMARLHGFGSLIPSGRGMGASLGWLLLLYIFRTTNWDIIGPLAEMSFVDFWGYTLITLMFSAVLTVVATFLILATAWLTAKWLRRYTWGFYGGYLVVSIVIMLFAWLRIPETLIQ